MNIKNPSISIVIPNYNGFKLLPETIEHAKNALKSSGLSDFEIIVSDDASTDRSLDLLAQSFPDVILVKSKENSGFAGNVNRGIQRSTKELVCLLNSDVHLQEGYFTAQVPLFENPMVFGVMGLIQEQGTKVFQDGAKLPSVSKVKIDSNKNNFSEHEVLPTLFLSGANALLRASYLKEMGGLNESFNPYYAEDVELGIRAWRMGWTLLYQPASRCFHAQSSTILKLPSDHVRTVAKRNKHFLHFLHLPDGFLWVYVLQVSVKAFFQVMMGNRVHGKALLSFYRAIPALMKQRQAFQNSSINGRVLSLMEVRKKILRLMELSQTTANPS